MAKEKKRRYSVDDYNGSISECLSAIEKDGYEPIGRFEKPLFREGKKGPEYVKQVIIYETVPKTEH
ncbi:NETI motif-containing protein [Pullulanibacillus sp. KACC 23026]|uniref:NETI motif-containing protein n=1 Tax=Pullulanibacillus sp. KACC 23026 TaxID=3028315 RepID=UPI0023B06992|nr:NETI motif-containing protein [Pullulanibacillus sp. KACC 23026]WEG12402.1 NETI motif-containing protein [Pullulanibacillus sp. KACC 23026]